MINVYALDPELLTNWSDFRFFISCFGYEKGRLIAIYPGKWKRQIYDSVQGTPIERKQIVESLRRIDGRLVKQSGRSSDGTKKWLDNAIAENAVRPFHAIVSRQRSQKVVANLINADRIDDTIDYDLLDDDDSRLLWKAPISKVIERDAETMAVEVADLINTSNHIRFVDGYFGPDSSPHRRPFQEFMKLFSGRDMSSVKIEYHCRQVTDKQYFLNRCSGWVTPSIPAGVKVEFCRWEKDNLHNRFILTDKGGIAFLEGLTSHLGTGREKDVIALLHSDTVASLNMDFDRTTTSMTLVDTIEVQGTMV